MKLYGTRIATQMWRRRDHFDACVYGNIHDCTVECKYFVQGDEAWRDDGNKDTVILYSPNDYVEFSESELQNKFIYAQEQAYLNGVVSFNRLVTSLQEKYKPARDDGFRRLKLLRDQRAAYETEIARLEQMLV